VEKEERIVSDEEMAELMNFGPNYYQKLGSPPIAIANGPAYGEDQLLRGHVGGVKYCEKDNESAESLQRKVFSALLGK